MTKIEYVFTEKDPSNIIRRTARALFLILHSFLTSYVFYDIIFIITDENYEILFQKIQYGLTAIVSLLSFFLYVWHNNVIQCTLQKLHGIEYSMKTIGIRQFSEVCFRTLIEVCVYLILMIIYIYTRYIRNFILHPQNSFVELAKNTLIRTYFLNINGFIVFNFIKSIRAAECRFKFLNHHVNSQVKCSFYFILSLCETKL